MLIQTLAEMESTRVLKIPFWCDQKRGCILDNHQYFPFYLLFSNPCVVKISLAGVQREIHSF